MKTLVRRNASFPSLFEDLFLRDLFDTSNVNWNPGTTSLPAVNVMETNDSFVLEVAAPGMKREDFHVELDNNMLTITSSVEENKEQKEKADLYTRREFSYQSFERTFALPENKVQGDKISAKYTDGVLYITVPKAEEAKVKPPKQIAIS